VSAAGRTPARNANAPTPAPAPLRIDIRRLHLHGYTPAQQQRFVAALEAELAQLARERRTALSAGPGGRRLELPRLDLRHAAADPVDAARQLARRLIDRAATSGNGHG